MAMPSEVMGRVRGSNVLMSVNLRLDGSVYVVMDALPLPAGAATAANQVAMITALQLIDDLRDALASVALDQLRVDVITSALPAGAATAANQATMITALQLIDDLQNALVSVGLDALLVQQLTHDLLNVNATLQIADVDVGPANLVPVDVANHVETTFDHGSNSAIGVAAAQLIAASTPATLGVEVKAANGNTANVYIGNADVTAASADATDGMELGPGESILVRIDNVNKIYAIAAAGVQRVFWLVV